VEGTLHHHPTARNMRSADRLRRIYRRFRANRGAIPRWLNVVRAMSTEGSGRIRQYSLIRERLDSDATVRRYLEGESTTLPRFFERKIQKKLGPFWDLLPPGALFHDHNAYLASHEGGSSASRNTDLGTRVAAAGA
jgi:hypothetical protein